MLEWLYQVSRYSRWVKAFISNIEWDPEDGRNLDPRHQLEFVEEGREAVMHRTSATALLRPGLKRLDLVPGSFPAVLPGLSSRDLRTSFLFADKT